MAPPMTATTPPAKAEHGRSDGDGAHAMSGATSTPGTPDDPHGVAAGPDSPDPVRAKELELQLLQRTHDEYVKSTCDYERELEAEVERLERRAQGLAQELAAADEARAAAQGALAVVQGELAASQRREEALTAQVDEMKWTIQRLEQANDELETAQRVAAATADELQHQLDKALEENVFLQQEREEAAATAANRQPRTGRAVSDAAGPEPANHRKPKDKRKSLGRYPEVVESCLHMTCVGPCRYRGSSVLSMDETTTVASPSPSPSPAPSPDSCGQQLKKRPKTKASAGFLERLRHRLFRA